MKIPKAFVLWIVMIPVSASAATDTFTLSGADVAQGDVVIVRRADADEKPFVASFGGKEYPSFVFGNRQTTFIPVHYQMRPGKYPVTVRDGTIEPPVSSVAVVIVRQRYPKLPYLPPKRSEKEQQKINKDSGQVSDAAKKKSPSLMELKSFVWPLARIEVTDTFGDRRCRDKIKGKLVNCRYHLGTDYRAAFDKNHSNPVAICAVNDGRVTLVASHLINGRIIMIDHGNGMSSAYLHLSKFLVKEGDTVKRGQQIGIAGRSGESEGIHLHFIIKMDNGRTIVDPHKFLKQVLE